MVRLDGGGFWMGSEDPKSFPSDGEGPVRKVTLSPFWIDATAVTNAAFARFYCRYGLSHRGSAIWLVLCFLSLICPPSLPQD